MDALPAFPDMIKMHISGVQIWEWLKEVQSHPTVAIPPIRDILHGKMFTIKQCIDVNATREVNS